MQVVFCDATGRARHREREYRPVEADYSGADLSGSRKHTTADLIDDYRHHATPGRGAYTIEDDYNRNGGHLEEQTIAKLLHSTYGGDIVLRAERQERNVKNPDYLWRGKLWDLKTMESAKRIGDRTRGGLHQIEDNPGGLIIDITKISISESDAWKEIEERVKISAGFDLDVILVRSGTVIGIKRFAH